jgi:outer membrane biosynthesis protein TonB
MPQTPTPLDPEPPQLDAERPHPYAQVDPDAPLTVIPHELDGSVPSRPVIIRTSRFGELEEHELVRLLDTIEDERARGRFRESIYISLFVWMVIVWVALYGPRYLWHSPQLINPVNTQDKQLTVLNAPVLSHPALPHPSLDRATLDRLRAMKPSPAPETPPSPAPVQPTAVTPAPTPPAPVAAPPVKPVSPPPILADAPTPQPSARRSPFSNSSSSDNMSNLPGEVARNRGGSSGESSGGISTPKGTNLGGGLEVLSDTQGVDFSAYLRRMHSDVMRNWEPLLPEETYAPLLKSGETIIILTILPDGKIGDIRLEGSTHDDAINRSAWGSLTSEGQFEPLPSRFHGPSLILRLRYMVNEGPR